MTTGTATLPDASTALLNMVPDETARLWLGRLSRQLPFLSDLIPADLTIYATVGDQRLVAIAQAHPTVRESFYEQSAVGTSLDPDPGSAIWRGLGANDILEGPVGKVVNGQPMSQLVFPIGTCGVLVVERNLYEELKHSEEKRRLYRTAITRATRTLIQRAHDLDLPVPSIQPQDSLLLVNDAGIVRHGSHSASALARKMGLPEQLEGLNWDDTSLPNRDLRTLTRNRVWSEQELLTSRTAISVRTIPIEPADDDLASILVLRDVSEIRQKERELAIKETIIREVHHRVKNNLQTIAALLRLQQRRSRNTEVKSILGDSIDRIASIALVHEYLSHEDVERVDLKELAYNLLTASMQSLVPPDKRIDARVVSPSTHVTLSSAKATSLALILNELLQNTLKHAFEGRSEGKVELAIHTPDQESVTLTLHDDGIGLPQDFDRQRDGNLGWEIVHTLAETDLRGSLQVDTSPRGTTVTVRIPLAEKE